MKIKDITMYTVEIPLRLLSEGGIAPYVGSDDLVAGTEGGTSHTLSILYRVETDSGIVGWGEMNPVISLAVQKQFFEEYIRKFLIGEDPFDIRQIMTRLAGVYNPQISPKTFFAGVEMACWDIMGKYVKRPVSDLLGGKVRDRVKIAYCLGMLPLADTAEKVKQICREGFHCIKTKGGNNVYDDIERTKVIREAGGDTLELRMDVNQSYDNITAIQYLRSVEDLNLQYIEQPLPAKRYDDMRLLRQRVKVPLAVNEDCYLPGNFMECVRRGAIDAAVVDMEQLGGIGELTRLAVIAQETGVPLAHHCSFDMGIKTAAILHAVCANVAFTYAMDSTYQAHADDILKNKIRINDGYYLLPEGPGLGIEVDEEKINRYSITECDRRFI